MLHVAREQFRNGQVRPASPNGLIHWPVDNRNTDGTPKTQTVQGPSTLIDAAHSAALVAAREVGVNNPTATVARPDPRLRLAGCPSPLTTRLTGQIRPTGRAVVQRVCPAAPSWSVHLPVNAQAKATVLVAARPLPRDYRVYAGDRRWQTLEHGALNSQLPARR